MGLKGLTEQRSDTAVVSSADEAIIGAMLLAGNLIRCVDIVTQQKRCRVMLGC